MFVVESYAAVRRFAAIRFYLEQIVPEAYGLEASAVAGSEILYAAPSEAFTV
jgi:3-(methylthio)propanoyl-CoA dehydrogenase